MSYLPNKLVNFLAEKLGAKTDEELAWKMKINKGTVSTVRTGARKPSAGFWLAAHEATGMSSKDIKAVGGF